MVMVAEGSSPATPPANPQHQSTQSHPQSQPVNQTRAWGGVQPVANAADLKQIQQQQV